MKIDINKIYNFIDRLGYTKGKDMPTNIIVDHINKKYNPSCHLYKVLLELIFWNTPDSIKNLLTYAIENYYLYYK